MHHWPAITESVHAQMLSDSRVPSYNLCNIQKEVEGECKRAWNTKCYSDRGCYSDTLITVADPGPDPSSIGLLNIFLSPQKSETHGNLLP